jgi:hypothetical protein
MPEHLTPITDAELAELRRLLGMARPGPWAARDANDDICDACGRHVCRASELDSFSTFDDLRLIVAARNGLPGLLARLEEAERERDEAEAEVKTIRCRLAAAECACEGCSGNPFRK